MASALPAASSSSNQQLPQPPTVATTLLHRRVMSRQRFDSADFAMSKQKTKTAAVAAPPSSPQSASSPDKHPASASSDVELDEEPEPEQLDSLGSLTTNLKIDNETSYSHQQQQVRRIRLQRFDSADWMLHGSPAQWLSPRSRREQGPPVSVAQLLLDRHAYTTCHFMSTA